MQIGVGLSLPLLATRRSGGFSPLSLFTGGTVGAWYDPSDYSTLFQDSAGTTPVTAVEQPVGLMLDKSQGLVLGSELVTNGDFSNGTTGWTASNASLSVVNGALRVAQNAFPPWATQAVPTVIGKTYKVVVSDIGGTAATNSIMRVGTTANGFEYLNSTYVTGTRGVCFTATTTTTYITLSPNVNNNGEYRDYDNITLREISPNFASQATSTSRPVLRARYNLLTYSEQFDNAAWSKGNSAVSANSVAAPDGTTTADLLYPSTSGTLRWVYQVLSATSAVYTRSVYAKAQNKSIFYIDATGAGTGVSIAYFNLSSGTVGTVSSGYTATITAVGNGWYRCTMTNTSAAAISFSGVYGVADADGSTSVTANGTDGIYIWGAQLVTGSSAGTYQRIAAATDYDTVGFLPYLAFDGTDDGMATNSINFSATDKMSVCAGVTKLVNARAALFDLSSAPITSAGSFGIEIPNDTAGVRGYFLYGSSLGQFYTAGTSAPLTEVLSVAYDIAASTYQTEIIPRSNGAALSPTSGSVAGTGNFSTYPLYIGRRGGSTLPFKGRIYGLIVAGKTLSASELSATESWMAAKTGVTL